MYHVPHEFLALNVSCYAIILNFTVPFVFNCFYTNLFLESCVAIDIVSVREVIFGHFEFDSRWMIEVQILIRIDSVHR